MRAMIGDVKLYIYIMTRHKGMNACHILTDVWNYIYILTRHKGMNAWHDCRRKTIYYILTRHKGMNACHDCRRKTIYIYWHVIKVWMRAMIGDVKLYIYIDTS